jgi:hypothetical protein
VAHALEVERVFVRTLDDEAPPTHLDDSVLGSLWRAGIDPREVLDHWLVAMPAEMLPIHAVTGDFPRAALRTALAEHYQIEERPQPFAVELPAADRQVAASTSR